MRREKIHASICLPGSALLVLLSACPLSGPASNAPDSGAPVDCTTGCGEGRACVKDQCLPLQCPTQQCGSEQVCVTEQCVDRSCVGVVCPTGLQCQAGICVDVQCTGIACPPAFRCELGACVDPTCTQVQCPPDQGCANGACRPRNCSAETCSPDELCDQNDACLHAACFGVVCTGGRACDGGFCVGCPAGSFDDGGVCVTPHAAGDRCAADGECATGICADGVCCESRCTGQCQSCAVPGSEGSCSAVVGSAGRDGGLCAPPLAAGQPCAVDDACASGLCIDGVCCDGPCSGGCQSCAVQGRVGTCSQLDGGTGRDGGCGGFLCAGQSDSCPSSCAADGDCAQGFYCSGGSCVAQKPKGASCSAANACSTRNCVSGVCCDTPCAGACERCTLDGGVGTCTPLPPRTQVSQCAPYVCNGGPGCNTSCANPSDCASSSTCSATTCVGKKGLGGTCTAATDCQSNLCVDGYCCNSACAGACDACNLPGQLGTCSARAAGTSGTPACAPYVCDGAGASCPTSCTANSGCVAGQYCVNGSCQASGVKPTAGTASITGSPIQAGTVLTAVPSGFNLGNPAGAYHYLWQRCTSSACTTAVAVGTDSATYQLVQKDAASFIRVAITATNTCASGCGSSAPAYSPATAAVSGTQQTRTLTIAKDMVVATDGSGNFGAGADPHDPCGRMPWLPGPARSFMQFNLNWTGVSRVVRAVLKVHTNSYHGAIGSREAIFLDRVTAAWAEGTYGANEVWNSGEVVVYPGPAATTTGRVRSSGQTSNATTYSIDVTSIVNDWAPASVLGSTGVAGGAQPNYGLRCIAQNEADLGMTTGFDSQESSNPPSLVLTFY